jgi:hypothetical protein
MEKEYIEILKLFFDQLNDEEKMEFLEVFSDRVFERFKEEGIEKEVEDEFKSLLDEFLELEKNENLKNYLSKDSKIKIIANIILQRSFYFKNEKALKIIEEELKKIADEFIKNLKEANL